MSNVSGSYRNFDAARTETGQAWGLALACDCADLYGYMRLPCVVCVCARARACVCVCVSAGVTFCPIRRHDREPFGFGFQSQAEVSVDPVIILPVAQKSKETWRANCLESNRFKSASRVHVVRQHALRLRRIAHGHLTPPPMVGDNGAEQVVTARCTIKLSSRACHADDMCSQVAHAGL